MNCRKFVASASFVLLVSGTAFAQAPPVDQKTRTDDLVKQALQRYNESLRAQALARADQAQQPGIAVVGAGNVPLTLADAVQRAIDNNLDLVVERLNPQTFDLTLAGLRSTYHPIATSRFGRNDNVRPPTSLLNPGSPNVSTMTYNGGLLQNIAWGGGNMSLLFNNSRVDSADLLANFNPQYNSSYLFAYNQPLLRNFKIDPIRQQISAPVVHKNTAPSNQKPFG